MSDHATAELLKAEAERSQDLIQGLRDATDKLVDRITDGDILAARYQAEREAARLELARYRVAVAAAVRAVRNDHCLSPSADATLWGIETFLGIDRDEPSTPEQDELAAELEALPYRDPKDAAACTGLTAQWCPVHGTCACDRLGDLDDPACPLHSDRSFHAAPLAAETIREFQDRGVLPSPDDGKPLLSDQQVQDDPFSLANTAAPELLAKADRVLADLVEGDGELSPEQAERFRRIHDAGMQTCPRCAGKGRVKIGKDPQIPDMAWTGTCPDCNGTGQVPAADRIVCPECMGTGGPDGESGLMNCHACNGEGEIPRPQPKGSG